LTGNLIRLSSKHGCDLPIASDTWYGHFAKQNKLQRSLLPSSPPKKNEEDLTRTLSSPKGSTSEW